ncbi:hypothetical protein PYW07_004667 [Mythimna separata]|uniref:Malate dehydrogenase, mitochondrial n=1 Tax=Mythimna separata TaxID=271217 RepID=A0AAD8DXY3_MYTSE|nr:hypothetical protein PYW07_004667 [Mythimna separata]
MVTWRSFLTAYRGGRRFLLEGRLSVLACDDLRGEHARRRYSTCPCPTGMKLTICGAAGCTGQPLALLLKQCPLLDEIALYDQTATCGYGMELSHVDTKCKITAYSGRHMLAEALKGSKVIVIVARNTQDSFEYSAPIVTEIALQICNICPSAFTVVATEPVESMVPLVGEINRLRGVYNPRLLLGCVELNCVRANTILADFLKVPPESVRVPVVGGATPKTMVPVLSAAVHPTGMTQEQVECVTSCIMNGTEAVCAAKGCSTATACLAGAYAIARTTINVVKGMQGKRMTQCGYVDSLGTCAPDCQYFATEVILGPSGIEKILGVPELSKFEHCLLNSSLPYVRNEIARAIWLVYTMCQQCCCPTCCYHPNTCYTPPICPCVPPTNWTCGCPDACRDEYLASVSNTTLFVHVLHAAICPCVPPTNWTCGCPDACRDEYLASVSNTTLFVHVLHAAICPCVPPTNWTCGCPDACRDEYLASVSNTTLFVHVLHAAICPCVPPTNWTCGCPDACRDEYLASVSNTTLFVHVLHVAICPCVPPTNWTCGCPDACRDEYLSSVSNTTLFVHVLHAAICPCVPPTNWTCVCPDACRDEYLASICREMTCTCGSTELCWRPRMKDYDAARAANITHQIPPYIPSCNAQIPRSIQITKDLLDKARNNPCCKTR